MLSNFQAGVFALLFASSSFAQSLEKRYFANVTNPKLVFDCRMPTNISPSVFDFPETSPFINDTAFGHNLTWSKIISIPKVAPSLFDPKGEEAALEVHITDASVFQPTGSPNSESAIRRAELSPNMSVPESTPVGYPDVIGYKALHFSLQGVPGLSLNFSHAYNLAWFESQKFDKQQWKLRTGTIPGSNVTDPKTLIFVGQKDENTPWFTAPFTDGWHNFAMVEDFNHNTIQLYYSMGTALLSPVTKVIPNDMTGGGQYHFGIFKKSSNYNASDGFYGQVTGYQPSGIDEAIIYQGIFMEDLKKGNLSTGPTALTAFVGGNGNPHA